MHGDVYISYNLDMLFPCITVLLSMARLLPWLPIYIYSCLWDIFTAAAIVSVHCNSSRDRTSGHLSAPKPPGHLITSWPPHHLTSPHPIALSPQNYPFQECTELDTAHITHCVIQCECHLPSRACLHHAICIMQWPVLTQLHLSHQPKVHPTQKL